MPKPKFANESTYKTYLEEGNESEFDQLFDKAIEEAKKTFGNQYRDVHWGQGGLCERADRGEVSDRRDNNRLIPKRDGRTRPAGDTRGAEGLQGMERHRLQGKGFDL